MTRFTTLVFAFLGLASASPAAAVLLPDSTMASSWALANGLEVRARHVPGARAVSVTLGWRHGVDDEPAARPGLAVLLGELALTGAAGNVPERTREEMESLRPLGWSLRVTRRHTLLTETASPAQLPGVLRQVAARLAGVSVSEAGLRAAVQTSREQLGQRLFGRPDAALANQVRELAAGRDRLDILALAAGRALEKLDAKEAHAALAGALVPANATLALAGDLSGLDVRAVVEQEFGAIPAGARRPDPAAAPLDSATVSSRQAGVAAPLGVVGVVAPALTDSLHPSFYLAMLVFGSHCNRTWGVPQHPLTSRFQYALLDDPYLVRTYPNVKTLTGPDALRREFLFTVDDLFAMTVTRDIYENLALSTLWILGGPMPPAVLQNVRRETGALNLLCGNMAAQALWADESFWETYRRRFNPATAHDFTYWASYLKEPRHQVTLVLTPN